MNSTEKCSIAVLMLNSKAI
uniref:Uncharacterized protein n=1 Tax=Arundo donax TaxID=35708 RepID=A0A0A9GNF3_ARUDO